MTWCSQQCTDYPASSSTNYHALPASAVLLPLPLAIVESIEKRGSSLHGSGRDHKSKQVSSNVRKLFSFIPLQICLLNSS